MDNLLLSNNSISGSIPSGWDVAGTMPTLKTLHLGKMKHLELLWHCKVQTLTPLFSPAAAHYADYDTSFLQAGTS